MFVSAAVFWIAFVYFCVAEILAKSLRNHLDGQFKRADSDDEDLVEWEPVEAAEWASSNNYVWVGSFSFMAPNCPTMTVLAWSDLDSGSYLVVYCTPSGLVHEFRTAFEGGVSVRTSQSKDGSMFPGEFGLFWQSFPGDDVEALFRRHIEAAGFVERSLLIRITRPETTFRQMKLADARRQIAYIHSRPMWKYRLPWWYFTRSRRCNRTIMVQFPKLGATRRVPSM
ncbi:MAG: hypothetical protein R3B57_02530 [Phycisphaerales bacterium]